MENRLDAKLTKAGPGARPDVAAIGLEGLPDRLLGRSDSVIAVDSWAAGIVWIETWACCDGWIVLDHSAHPDVCRGMESDSRQVLWCEPNDADYVLAMLAELRGRSETQRILVVRQVALHAALDSPEIAALHRLCHDYRATLLVVIQTL